MVMTTVFFLGATGYLGGAILAGFVNHHDFQNLKITALVRRKDHEEAVRKLGVEVVKGTLNDTELITKHARTADITVNAAGSDDTGLTKAILAGQKARVVEDKKSPAALFHTSGVAVFAGSKTDGKHDPNLKLWNDGKEDDIRAITPEMMHGPVDVLILSASEDGYTESYIMCPGAIVGPSTGPVPTASLFIRYITGLALEYKKAVYVGEGSNIFYAVRLDDLVELYKLVFSRILTREDAKASPYTRYYIAASTPIMLKDIATLFGETLKELGKVEDSVPQSISVAADWPIEQKVYFGASQRIQAERAKALGWEPRPVVLREWMAEGVEMALRVLQKTSDP